MKTCFISRFFLVVCVLFIFVGCAGSGKSVRQDRESGQMERSYASFLRGELVAADQPGQYEQWIDEALKNNKKSAYLWARKSLALAGRSQLDEALEAVNHALKIDPTSVDQQILLAQLHLAKKETDQAITILGALTKAHPDNQSGYLLLAQAYHQNGKRSLSWNTLKSCVALASVTEDCRYTLALSQIEQQNYRGAVGQLTTLYQDHPDDPRLVQLLSDLYLQLKEPANAVRVLEQHIKNYPSDVVAANKLGLIYFDQKRPDDAIRIFEQVRELYPSSDRVNYVLGMIYFERDQMDQSYERFDSVSAAAPFIKETLFYMIQILSKHHDEERAINLIDRKIPADNQTVEMWVAKTSLYQSFERYEQALAAANSGLKRFKNDKNLMFQKASALDHLDRWSEARVVFEELLKADADNPALLNYYGYTLLTRHENLDQAYHMLKRALEFTPDDGRVTDSLAWAHFLRGDLNEARQLLERADRLVPGEPTILEHLGDVWLALKNRLKADMYYNEALKALGEIERPRTEHKRQEEAIRKKLLGENQSE